MGGKHGAGLGRLLAPILLLCATGGSAQSQQVPQQASLSPAIIVLDGSRSMWTKLGGQSKVAIVRSNLGDAFKTYEDRIAFGLVAAGHRQGKTCAEAELIAKPGELTSKTPGKLLFGAGFKPKLGRPIAAALVEAAKQTPPAGLDVVLITDGLDSCKANVCATAKLLKQAAPGLRISVQGSRMRGANHRRPVPHGFKCRRPEARPNHRAGERGQAEATTCLRRAGHRRSGNRGSCNTAKSAWHGSSTSSTRGRNGAGTGKCGASTPVASAAPTNCQIARSVRPDGAYGHSPG
jgi:hypothetical protein